MASMSTSAHADDVQAIQSIEGIDTILEILKEVTGRRIALVARLDRESWTACAVLDDAGFGLKPGDTLDLATTY